MYELMGGVIVLLSGSLFNLGRKDYGTHGLVGCWVDHGYIITAFGDSDHYSYKNEMLGFFWRLANHA